MTNINVGAMRGHGSGAKLARDGNSKYSNTGSSMYLSGELCAVRSVGGEEGSECSDARGMVVVSCKFCR